MDNVTSNLNKTLNLSQTNTALTKEQKGQLLKIKKTCQDFEAIFIYSLLKNMRQTIPKSKNAISYSSNDTYNMILDQKIAENFSRKGNGLGLQKMLYDQLTKNQTKNIKEEGIK
jgi:peptidoglycan hydrolase FlgJ